MTLLNVAREVNRASCCTIVFSELVDAAMLSTYIDEQEAAVVPVAVCGARHADGALNGKRLARTIGAQVSGTIQHAWFHGPSVLIVHSPYARCLCSAQAQTAC